MVWTVNTVWPVGRKFTIDQVDIWQVAPLKRGGLGIRYTCRICGKQVFLFDDGQAIYRNIGYKKN